MIGLQLPNDFIDKVLGIGSSPSSNTNANQQPAPAPQQSKAVAPPEPKAAPATDSAAIANSMGIDVKKILQEAQQTGDSSKVIKALSDEKTAAHVLAGMAQQAAPSAIQARKDQLQQHVKEFQDRQIIQKAMGADATDQSSLISQLSRGHTNAVEQAAQDYQNINKANNIHFLDHPIDWLEAQFKLPGYREDFALHARGAQWYEQQINNVNTNFQSTAESQHLIDSATTAKDAADTLKAYSDQVNQKADEASLNALGVTADVAKAIRGFKLQDIAQHMKVLSEFESYQRARLAESQAFFTEQLNQNRFEGTQQKEAAYNAGADLLKTAHAKAPEIDLDKKTAALIMSIGKTKMLGDTPGSAAVTLSEVPNNLKNSYADLLRSAKRQAVEKLVTNGNKSPTADQVEAQVNDMLLGKQGDSADIGVLANMQQHMNTPRIGTYTNPFTVPDIPTIAAAVPFIKDTQFYQKVLQPLLTTADKTPAVRSSDPVQIAQYAREAIQAGEIKPEVAANGIEQLYKAGVFLNNGKNKFNLLGYKGGQQHYNVGRYDFTDYNSILHYLLNPPEDTGFFHNLGKAAAGGYLFGH